MGKLKIKDCPKWRAYVNSEAVRMNVNPESLKELSTAELTDILLTLEECKHLPIYSDEE